MNSREDAARNAHGLRARRSRRRTVACRALPGRALLLGVLGAALALGAMPGCSSKERPQRIVLITLDTLRYDGFAGPDGDARMPALNALARRGASFERSYAATSNTQSTHASLLTGLQPWAHGVTRNGLVLAGERETLAERLKEHGYETHAVVASFPLHERFGFAQGFDSFVDDFDVPYVRTWEGEQTEQGTFFSLASTVTREAQAALDAATGDRQFFWFHYFDPHDPYGDAAGGGKAVDLPELLTLAARKDPRLDAELRRARRRYDDDLLALDRSLATLFARLAVDEEHYDTLIVVTADHGESFGEHLSMGHGKRVTPEQVHVPLVIVGPSVPESTRRDAATSVDVATTLLAAAGVDATGFEGRDLFAAGAANDDPTVFGMRRTFSEPRPELTTDGERRALPPTWFYAVQGDLLVAGDGTTVLRDDDTGEALDDASAAPWRAKFDALGRLLAAGGEAQSIDDPETLNALHALGYGG